MRLRHAEVGANALEAEFAVGAFEGERVFGGNGFVVFEPFVHAPEVGGFEIEFEFIDEAGNEGELFGGTDWAADAGWIVGRRGAPGVNVFEGFGEVEVFEGIVENNLEAGAGKLEEIVGGEFGDVTEEVVFEGGVVPPVGGDG